MNGFSHFYSRYGQAILYEGIDEDLNHRAKDLLSLGLENFRLRAGVF